MTTRLLAAVSAAASFAVLAPAASAAQVVATRVATPDTTSRSCLDRAPAGAAGIVQRRVVPRSDGILGARLTATSGDWDLALFDAATGTLLGGSAGFGATEVTSGAARGDRPVIAQACRRKGDASAARLTVVDNEIPAGAARQRVSLARVSVDDRADKARLGMLGFDLTEHAGHDYVEVVLHDDAERRRLNALGFRFDEEVRDLGALERDRIAADRAYARRAKQRQAGGAALPSGRTGYRTLADYESEMKRLVERFPGLVRPITLKLKTVEGREVHGIEIAENVNVSDGRPVFLQMGVHHAREWPSGEHAMEWAYELVNGVGREERVRRLTKAVRTIIVPVVNPDGFDVSRSAPVDTLQNPAYQQLPAGSDPSGAVETASYLYDPAGAYRRRNCRIVAGQSTPPGSCKLPANRGFGVDPNRNYGGFWGGAGASALPLYETFRGSGPFSEPETQNVRDLVSTRHVTTLITNHTFSNLILRPPGIKAVGPPADEGLLNDLGARMAAKNGYTNQPSYALYDTTGGTEDWTYYATGSLGYTFEIGPGDGTAQGPNPCYGFHPPFACVVKHYTRGENDGGGNREAYFLAMENAADATKHSVVTGSAPKGVTLRLRKEFVTETSPVRPAEDGVVSGPQAQIEGDRQRFPDVLNTTLPITEDGTFRWQVNPSTRPLVATNRFIPSSSPVRSQKIESKKQTTPDPGGTGREDSFEDVPFTLDGGEGAKQLEISVSGNGPADDYDLTLFRKKDGKLESVATSGNSPGTPEAVSITGPGAGEYVLRVQNFAAVGGFAGKLEIFDPSATQTREGVKEAWTLSCELDGKLLAAQKVVVDRGETANVRDACGPDAEEIVKARAASRPVCASQAGFASTAVTPVAGRRSVRFAFARRVASPVTVDVFQASTGRRILANRNVASFRNRLLTFTWDGEARGGKQVTDGVFFVRLRVKGTKVREDLRRHTLVRRNGRWSVPRTFYRPASCGLLASLKLGHPAFGGTTNRPLGIAYRVAARADVTVRVLRGTKVVRTFRRGGVAARRTHRLSLASRGLAAGLYKVQVSVRSGGRTAGDTVYARRL